MEVQKVNMVDVLSIQNEYRIFKLAEATIQWWLEKKSEKQRTWNNSVYNTYIRGESQGKSLCKHKFHFISFTKLKDRRVENDLLGSSVLVCGGGFRERHERVNIVQPVCTHVWKLTNETCQSISRMWGTRLGKHNDGGCEFRYDKSDIL
jgi:hypothetical protein